MIELLVRLQNHVQHLVRDIEEARRTREGRGATSVEYAIMAGVISVGIIASFAYFTTRVATNFNKVPTTWV
jgi:Flp pilus assembly pilin Flp